jgi:phytoene/squalene synthetase
MDLIKSLNGKVNTFRILFSFHKHDKIDKKFNAKYFLIYLSAFKQDVLKKRYNNFNEVLDYCKRSANPVGRILLDTI